MAEGFEATSPAAGTGERRNLLGDRQHLERICFRNLLATPGERVFFKDREGHFLLVSEGFLKDQAGGSSLEDVIGKSDLDFFSAQHAGVTYEDEQEVIRTGEPMVAKMEHETFYDRPDAWVSTTKLPLRDDDGSIVGILGISRDVTGTIRAEQALAESETRFRSIFEQAPLGILRVDTEQRIVDANQALCELAGRRLGDLLGSHRATLFDEPEETSPGGGAGGPGLGSRADGPRSSQRQLRRPDGNVRLVQVNDVVIRDQDGRSRALVATVEDITDGLRLADELRRAQQMEALGQLAAGIAHEINTPTQFISDNLAFLSNIWPPVAKLFQASREAVAQLRDGGRPADVAAGLEQRCLDADLAFVETEVPLALSQSREGVERVAMIVRAMKAFGRPDNSDPEPTNLDRLVTDAITVAHNKLKYVAEVVTDLGSLPPVTCYPGAISQVVINLLVNAAYAVGQCCEKTGERGQITVKTWLEGDQAHIRVSDTGPGIPPDVLPRIFQPFFTTKPFGRGTGQGLALAWATVVDRHRGRIEVGTSSSGATFTVSLPMAVPAGPLGAGRVSK